MNLSNENFNKKIVILGIFISILPFLFLLFLESVLPNNLYRMANVFGYIGGVLMLWQFALGIRRVAVNLTSDYDWLIKIHTFLGINSAIFVLLHPILESYTYTKGLGLFGPPNLNDERGIQIFLGSIAFFLFLIIWFSSSLLRKKIKYRFWLYIHYLTYPMMYLIIIHPFIIGTFLNSIPFIKFYWIFIGSFLFIFTLIKLSDVLNINSVKYKLIEIKKFPGDIYSFIFSTQDLLPPVIPGQYFYIKKDFFGEAHPFSVLTYDQKKNVVEFGFKVLGRFTQELALLNVGDEVYIDGPYGQFTIEGQNSFPKVIIAGGIGITPFYELVQKFGNDKTFLFYSNIKLEFALLRDEFKKMLGNRYFDCIDGEKVAGENIICSMMTPKVLQEKLSEDIINQGKFFICGGPGFMNGIKKSLLEIGVEEKQIYIEEFGY